MTVRYRIAGIALLSASLGAVALAQAPKLNIRMGAWEVGVTANLSGLPGMDTSKMTPDQKARMDAMMQARGNQPARTSKTCINQENYQRGAMLEENDPNLKCTRTIETNTATVFDSTRTCTGQDTTRVSHTHIEALTPTAIKATVSSKVTRAGRTTSIDATTTGKWLAADCKGIN